MSLLLSVIIGFIQGAAELLPLSGSGHSSVLQNLFKLEYTDAERLVFDVLLHFGTLCAVVFCYRADIKRLVTESVSFASGRGASEEEGRLSPGVRTVLFILVGTVPLFFIAPFYDRINELYSNTVFIGIAFLVNGALLFTSDRITPGRKSEKTFTVADALVIGAAQMISVIPGLSRTGTVLTISVARGLKRGFAVRFTYLLSIPAALGYCLLSLFRAVKGGADWSAFPAYLAGMVVAAVVGYFAVRLVRFLVKRARLGRLSYYCWAAGLVTIILSIVL